MTDRPVSPLVIALVAFASPWVSSLSAQEFPPAPPLPARLVQEQAPLPTPRGPVLSGPVLSGPILPEQAPRPDDLPPPADPSMAVPEADIEAFARGPVHAAFADVYELDPAPNVIVTVAPPAAVDELPPEQAPTGENVQWISGYWSWDEESNDYLWVSGVWRDVPPGRRWVPGYWAEVTGGFQWIAGFWTNFESQELTYVPQPPASLEIGPNVPPPGDDQVWVPGNWSYASNNYQWSPGYYMPCQQNYMWIPNQYNWTPNGCVYVPGYWDYRFAQRGTLFSPVRFRRSLVGYGFGRPACYRPRYSVNMAGFLIHLFVRPRCRNFYYGDYYGNQYANIGFSPWYRRTTLNRRLYDPAYSFYRMDSHRQGIDFDRSVNTWHQRFESNRDIRPPRLMQDQDQFLARHQGDRSAQLAVTTDRFDDVVKQHNSGNAFRTMDRQELDVQRENNRVNHTLENARRQLERSGQLVKSGDLKPGQVVDLRLKDASGRSGREGNRDPGGDAAVAKPNKLVLGNLPQALQEKSKHSADTAERIRQQSKHRSETNPMVSDRTQTKGATTDPGNGAPHPDELRQKNDAPRISRDAGNKAKGGNVPEVVNPAGRNPRILDGGPLVNPKADLKIDKQPGRVVDDKSAKDAQDQVNRALRDVEKAASRVAPTPAAVENRLPRAIESSPKLDAKPMKEHKEHVVRERTIVPRNDNPAPVIRQEQKQKQQEQEQKQSIERAPKMEKAPVQHVPRQVERQAPVERAPVQKVERQAPAERAPRAERPAGGNRQPSNRKGKD